MKRALRAAASLLLVFALAVMVFPSQGVHAAADVVNIYHTNDVHGGVEASFNEETKEIENPAWTMWRRCTRRMRTRCWWTRATFPRGRCSPIWPTA